MQSINDGVTIVHWVISNLVKEIRLLFGFFKSFILHFVPRYVNFVAHNVAAWAATSNVSGVLNIVDLPKSIWCALALTPKD